MSKKPKRIKITERDQLILKITSKNGSISHKMLTETLKLDRRTIYRLVNAGYLNKENYQVKKGKKIVNRYSYTLGSIGQEYVLKNKYTTDIQGINGYNHGLKGEEVVYKMLTEDNFKVENILSEAQLKVKFSKALNKSQKRSASVTDFGYLDENKDLHLIEIETKNYRKAHRDKHKYFANNIAKAKSYSIK